MSNDDPIPVAPLNYLNPSSEPRRPGIMTALAIAGIVVAGLGLLFNLWASLALMLFATPQQQGPTPIGANPMTVQMGGATNVYSAPRSNIPTTMQVISPQAQAYIVQITALAGKPLTPMQQQSIQTATNDAVASSILSMLNTPVVTNTNGAATTTNSNGTTTFYYHSSAAGSTVTNSGPPNSNVTAVIDQKGTLTLTTLTGTLVIPANGGGTSQFNIGLNFASMRKNLIFVGADGVYSLALSVYLLIIGILVLRSVRQGRRLYQIYLWLKVPVIVATATFLLLFREVGLDAMPFLILPLIGWIFPIVVFFVVRRPKVRDYYARLQVV